MSTHAAHYGFSFNTLRGVLHLPRVPTSRATPKPVPSAARLSWMARLANWAERQPMHHRMGSYMRMR